MFKPRKRSYPWPPLRGETGSWKAEALISIDEYEGKVVSKEIRDNVDIPTEDKLALVI
jgi:hypothetical protein